MLLKIRNFNVAKGPSTTITYGVLFNGMSGSGIASWLEPNFCGIAVRAFLQNGCFHFALPLRPYFSIRRKQVDQVDLVQDRAGGRGPVRYRAFRARWTPMAKKRRF